MRDVLVLGSGRSGTSMVTGALASAGYHLGEALHAPRAANPKGFFEAPLINDLNDGLLAAMLPADSGLEAGQRWLGAPKPGTRPAPTVEQASAIERATQKRPYCYKDPRFSFTLPAWRSAIGDAGLVCVFRHPAATAVSMVEEVKSAPYLANVSFDIERAIALWIATYRAILDEHSGQGDWLFLHYDQVLGGDGLARLATFLGAKVDGGFPDAKLRREPPAIALPDEALAIYDELCRRAGFSQVARHENSRPRVGVIVPVQTGEEASAQAAIATARAQRGVEVEVVVLDRTGGRLGDVDARVIQSTSLSFGVDLVNAARVFDTPFVAIERPGCPSLPSRLAHAVARLADGAEVVTCDYVLTDAHGQFVQRVSPAAMGDTPGPRFDAGLVMRREAFEGIDRTAFHPVLLATWRRLVHAGRATHVEEPGFALPATLYAREWERSREDARLVTLLGERRNDRAPELTVSICSYNRKAILAECLEAFCRQSVAHGTFEIVLVDDGSTDGTHEMLAGLELPVPFVHLRRANGGLSAARNTGLEVARGRLVLFVNDDTIPHHDCVSEHLAAHRAASIVGEPKLAVLGTFEQPIERHPRALASAIARTNTVFDYAALTAGERYDCWKFWTCNVSVATALVRAAGAFDPSFRHYGCEDTDLGLRLEDLGMRVLYHPRARAEHCHDMDFGYLARRGPMVARAYVRLVRKHPKLLERWNNSDVDLVYLADCVRSERVLQARREAGAAQLARIDRQILAPLGAEYLAPYEAAVQQLEVLLPELSRGWWNQGYAEGLVEHGLTGFRELVSDGVERWPISATAPRTLLARPDWSSPSSLDRVMELVAPIAHDGFAALVLRRDPNVDPPSEECFGAVEAAFARRYGPEIDLEVVIEESEFDRPRALRFGRSADAFLAGCGEDAAFVSTLSMERLASADDVASWRRRYEGAAHEEQPSANASAPALPAPRLSVIVPTCNRPRELRNLIVRLGRSDLDPLDFEVIVVDDGSQQPIDDALAKLAPHIAVRVLRQENRGPAAARNLGLERARGAVVVFLNDDAVPAEDLLSRHLAAQEQSHLPRAVIGRFTLLPEHRNDSLADHIETTTTLFAQPCMQAGVHYRGLSLCTGNVSLRRDHLVAVGGFDEGFPSAGGEDSELGLRLERALGLRVVFEPTIECGHDHALDVRSLAARKRAIGRSVHRIQSLHGDVGLVPGATWPMDAATWARLANEVSALALQIEEAMIGVARICAAERKAGEGARVPQGVRAQLERIEHVEFFAGLVEAQRLASGAPNVAAPKLVRAA